MANPLNLSPAFRKWIEQLLCCWSPESFTVTDLTVSDDLTVGGDAAVTGSVTAADLIATDDLTVGDDATVGGDLAVTGAITAANVTATATVAAADVTVSDDLTVTDDFTLGGLFTRATVDQPIIRKGIDTLAGGTLVVAATWVTAAPGTVINLTYTGGAAIADALSYTQTAGVGFTVFGTGNNTFSWTGYTDGT